MRRRLKREGGKGGRWEMEGLLGEIADLPPTVKDYAC